VKPPAEISKRAVITSIIGTAVCPPLEEASGAASAMASAPELPAGGRLVGGFPADPGDRGGRPGRDRWGGAAIRC